MTKKELIDVDKTRDGPQNEVESKEEYLCISHNGILAIWVIRALRPPI